MKKQINTPERVYKFGEVYTSEREVNKMLNLVENETLRIDSRFLEPACGNGNFLTEVLKRKLQTLKSNYKDNQHSFDKYSLVLIGSLYGIDILNDNIISARKRLYGIYKEFYELTFKESNPNILKNINYILEKNITQADALTFLNDKKKPLILSEWSLFNENITRRDFEYKNLIEYSPFEEGTLFSDLGEQVIIPTPIKEYPLTNYLKIYAA